MPSTAQKLLLYRRIIKAAKAFPSIKRDGIVQEIRHGFRENRSLTEGEAMDNALQVAFKGLEQLEQYSNLPSNSTNWKVSMDSNPMPNNKPHDPEEIAKIPKGQDRRSGNKASDRNRG